MNKFEAKLAIEYEDQVLADSIVASVSPDNFQAPATVSVKTARKGCTLITQINALGRMTTFIATIDDLLFSIGLAEKTLKAIQQF